jgi:hypothetical protein
MIDYDKLKTAHELAYNLCQQTGMRVDIILCWVDSEYPDYILMDYTSDKEYLFSTVEGLIVELTELTKAKSKYKVGDEVWYLDVPINEIYLSQVLKVRDREYVVDGDTNGTKSDFIESELHPTKDALIAAQAAYWSAMQEPYKPEFEGEIKGFSDCEHDGFISCRKCNSQWTTGFRVIQKELIEECQHETNGLPHPIIRGAMMEDRKCIKCGAYYR